MKLNDAIKIVPPTPKSAKIYRRDFYEAKIGKASATGATSDEAVNNLKGVVKQAFDGDYSPSLVPFRGFLGILWRETHGWYYKILPISELQDFQSKELHGCTQYETAKSAQASMRNQLAFEAWDGEEESSPVIIDTQAQAKFQKDAIWQKRYRALKAIGMDDNAIRNQLWDEGL